jgi:Coenzyme PQQ synthesis protein D (PqqD)
VSGDLRLRGDDLEWRLVEGEVIALDVRDERYLELNDSGSKLWEALGRGAKRQELVEILVAAYGIERAAAERDVEDFLTQLHRQGLLESTRSVQ